LRRRLAFGRAILHRPQVLLLREPFARCDQATIALLGHLVHDLAEAGAAVLILADDTANLDPLCDAIYMMNGGRLAETPRPDDKTAVAQPFKIPVRAEDKVILLNPADIRYVEAQGGHAIVQTATGRLTTQFTLAELETRLARSGFFRAHRSYLVNLQHIREIIPYTRNSFSLRLDDAAGTEIPLSKSAAGELRELLGY
jgi:ABC-2 type transport system ATP-binding protein